MFQEYHTIKHIMSNKHPKLKEFEINLDNKQYIKGSVSTHLFLLLTHPSQFSVSNRMN